MPNANYSYYTLDPNDQRQGAPYNVQQLQTLADRGSIIPMTRMERNDGVQGFARQIPGLNFIPEPPPPVSDVEKPEDDPDELPAILILLWVGFGCSCVLAIVGLWLWVVVSLIALPVAIVLLVLALKERERNIERNLENRARQGDIRAMYDLACKRESQGKYDDAVHWFRQAADQGHTEARKRVQRKQREEEERQRKEQERLARQQQEEEDRRRKQEAEERYKQNILSGRISYDSEMIQLAGEHAKYATVLQKAMELWERHSIVFKHFMRGGDDNGADILREIERLLQTIRIERIYEIQAQAKKLNEIKYDTRTRKLIEACEVNQQAYMELFRYVNMPGLPRS